MVRRLRIDNKMPRYGGARAIPSADASELYFFHPDGRHDETQNSRTGAVLWKYEYNPDLTLSRAVRFDAFGEESQHIRLARNAEGEVTDVFVDPDGLASGVERRHRITLGSNGYLATLVSPAEEQYTAAYDNPNFEGVITSFTEPSGRQKHYTYDEDGRLLTQTDAPIAGHQSGGTFAYTRLPGTESDLPATEMTSPSGFSTYFGKEKGEGTDRQTATAYADGTNRSSIRDRSGSEQSVARDGTVTEVVMSPDPAAFSVHRYASETSTTLPESGTSRTSTRTKEADVIEGYVQNTTDQQCIDSSQGQLCTTVNYNAAAGVRTTTTPEGRVTTELLDALSRLTELRAPGSPVVRTHFDGDRVTSIVIDPDGVENNGDERSTVMQYDSSSGLLAKVIDPLTHETLFGGYDGADRPGVITLPDSSQVQMTYDAEGNVASVTPPGKLPHGMTYGPRGRIESYTPPVGNAVSFHYDLDRRMDLIDFGLDAFNQPNEVDFEYDPVTGQLSTILSPTGTIQVGFTNGHMTTLTAPTISGSVTTSIDYDGFLPTSLSWAGTVSGEVNWTYNDRFLIQSETIGALPATTVNYSYDDDGLVTQAGDLTITRDPTSGRVVQKRIGRIRETFEYNEFAELSRQTVDFMALNGTSVQETLYDVVYDDDGVNGDRDALGRITKKTEWIVSGDEPNGDGSPRALDARTYDYGYNPDGRPWLESVAVDGTLVSSYGYDENGNRTSVELNWSQLGYDAKFDDSLTEADTEYDSADKLLTYGTKSYTWNNFGQLSSMTDSDPDKNPATTEAETTFYQYDLFGNLLRVDLHDGRAIEYEVDGAGRRVGRRELDADGFEISFRGWIYRDLLRPIAEVDAQGNVVARYIYRDGIAPRQDGTEQVDSRIGASQDHSLPFAGDNVPESIVWLDAASDNVVATYRLVVDQVGTPRLLVDVESGTVVQRLHCDSFGRVFGDSQPGMHPFGFAGGLFDGAVGTLRLGARDLDLSLGRWLARDSIRTSTGDTNAYIYGRSEPVGTTDPTGFQKKSESCSAGYSECMKDTCPEKNREREREDREKEWRDDEECKEEYRRSQNEPIDCATDQKRAAVERCKRRRQEERRSRRQEEDENCQDDCLADLVDCEARNM